MTSDPEQPVAVLVADDDDGQRLLVERILGTDMDPRCELTLVPDGSSALKALRESVFDVALLDLSMPGLDGLEVMEAIAGDPARPQVIFVSGRGSIATATQAMKLGAFDFLEKPVQPDQLRIAVYRAAAARSVFSKTERLQAVVSRGVSGVQIVTADPGMTDVLQLLERVAPSDVSVLITGESGTGKELIARELHRLSARYEEPMVALNCAAVAESLAESELFGHEKGAFTGAAARKIGLIELADGGTLFLDEIGDLALGLQAKLLRALEARVFRRVGGLKELPANFRLVSATHRPLRKLVEDDSFREDLFYRINAVVIDLPPLRERPDDILLLTNHFLAERGAAVGRSFRISPEAEALLRGYPWPGNVRELRNVIERAALLSRGETIGASDLGALAAGDLSDEAAATGDGSLPALDLGRLESMAIEEALERTGWHQGRAAELLGISDRTLHRKIRGLGLERPR